MTIWFCFANIRDLILLSKLFRVLFTLSLYLKFVKIFLFAMCVIDTTNVFLYQNFIYLCGVNKINQLII